MDPFRVFRGKVLSVSVQPGTQYSRPSAVFLFFYLPAYSPSPLDEYHSRIRGISFVRTRSRYYVIQATGEYIADQTNTRGSPFKLELHSVQVSRYRVGTAP